MKFWKNCIFQVYSVENIKLIATERRSSNIVPKMFLFQKAYIKIYLFSFDL